MKWLWRIVRIAGITIMLLLLAPTVSATPDPDFQSVTIRAEPRALDAPTDFTLTYISDTEVGITWTKDDEATNTLIRAKIGAYPEDTDDGWQVYYDTGDSYTDTGPDLDKIGDKVYYRAWSWKPSQWSNNYAEGNIGGYGVTFIGEILLVALIIGLTFYRRDTLLYMIAAPACFMMGLDWANDYLVPGIVVCAIGGYCLLMAILRLIRRFSY